MTKDLLSMTATSLGQKIGNGEIDPVELTSKYFEAMDHRFSMGLNVFNLLDIRNAWDIWPLTGKPDDPGTYYTNYVGLPGTDPLTTKIFSSEFT